SADTIAARPVAEASFPANTRWPVKAKSISYLTGKLYGVVITAEENDLVQSLSSGTVISAGPYRGFGKVAIVQAANGYLYVYGGCDILNVREGESIKNGTVLGRIGVDSISKQPQLYFLVYKDNKPVDPASAPRG
ncbi:MAG TPA: peptidoglycan DD-metalloendopeptidase family protein, partial [Treponema sp.]|nr:peptidoglycan DD-metalloendopeptidase family protein [Treponema sp.]